MNSEPLVSVVIPVYNVIDDLVDALDSIVKQTFTNLDIVIVDDGSTDRSEQIVDEYAAKDSRIRVIHQSNMGLAAARNRGIAEARGDFLVFMDSDDLVGPLYVEHLLTCSMKYDADIAITGVVAFEDGIGAKEKIERCLLVQRPDGTERGISRVSAMETMLYQKGIEPSAYAKIYKSSLFAGVRYPNGKLYEDIGTTATLFDLSSTIVQSSYVDYFYRLRPDSIQQASYSHRNMDLIDALDGISVLVSQAYPSVEPALRSKYLSAAFNVLMKMTDEDFKKYPEDRTRLWKIIKLTRMKVLVDGHARLRARLSALLSFLGFSLVNRFYVIYRKHKKKL